MANLDDLYCAVTAAAINYQNAKENLRAKVYTVADKVHDPELVAELMVIGIGTLYKVPLSSLVSGPNQNNFRDKLAKL